MCEGVGRGVVAGGGRWGVGRGGLGGCGGKKGEMARGKRTKRRRVRQRGGREGGARGSEGQMTAMKTPPNWTGTRSELFSPANGNRNG